MATAKVMELTKFLGRRQIRDNIAGYCFLLPSLLGFIFFVFIPLFFSLFLSFSEWSMISGLKGIKMIGLENLKMIPLDPKFEIALRNTLKYTILAVPASIILGFIVAVLIHDYVFGKSLLKILVFLPYISSLVAITVVWMVLLNPTRGPVNMFLRGIGITNPPGWFASSQWAIVGVAFETIWLTIGYNVVLYMAGFTSINTDLYDAASIDGCGEFRRVIHITLPGVAPTTFFLSVMAIINAFKVFDQISVLYRSTDALLVIAYQIYQLAFIYFRMGYASATAWVLFLLVMIITVFQWKFNKSGTPD